MAGPRRVALMFDLDGADMRTRELVSGVHRWAAEHPGRWHIVHDPYARARLAGHYDGLIAPGSRVLLEATQRAGLPYVAIACSGYSFRIPRVRENARWGGLLAARHLMERGYTHFAFVGLSGGYASSLIEDGFRSGLSRRGQVAKYLIFASHSQQTKTGWSKLIGRLAGWLDELPKPVGVFAARDVLALYLAELCVRKGLRVPEEVGIVGAGNDPAICLAPPVPLTSIDFAWETVGQRAALLLDELMGGAPPPKGNVLVPPTLVPRASTGRAEQFSDTKVADALGYIGQHAHEQILVGHVAEAVGLGQRQLVRRFQRTRRRTVVQEITRARLRNARDILQATELPVGAVARAVGFRAARHLTAVFRRHHGVTPAVWRRGRPTPPPFDPADLSRAKWFLEGTGLTIRTIAAVTGFGTVERLIAAFRSREGVTPGDYRQRHRVGRRAERRLEGHTRLD